MWEKHTLINLLKKKSYIFYVSTFLIHLLQNFFFCKFSTLYSPNQWIEPIRTDVISFPEKYLLDTFSLQSLVCKIERMGISNIMANPSALSLAAGLYARPALTSPMAQLTCLLPSHSNENILQMGQKPLPITTSPVPGELEFKYLLCLLLILGVIVCKFLTWPTVS